LYLSVLYNRIIISFTESLFFSLASMTLTFLFSDDNTYDLAVMQKNELIGWLKFGFLPVYQNTWMSIVT
jgi:hypothetical protein